MSFFTRSTVEGFIGASVGFAGGCLRVSLARMLFNFRLQDDPMAAYIEPSLYNTTPEDRAILFPIVDFPVLMAVLKLGSVTSQSFSNGISVGYMMAILGAGEVPVVNYDYSRRNDLSIPFC